MNRSRPLHFLSDYGMVAVLLGLAAWFSLATLQPQFPSGAEAARNIAAQMERTPPPPGPVMVVAAGPEAPRFASELERWLKARGREPVVLLSGDPAELRSRLAGREGVRPAAALACTFQAAQWDLVGRLRQETAPGGLPVYSPAGHLWPQFLRRDNLLNIANQIAVIAILAIGMTLVILTRGIDLSVGSLIALSAVTVALLIQEAGGAEQATWGAMLLSACGAMLLCGLLGLFSGWMVAGFGVPPFIATLGMMLVASGLAYLLSGGQSVYRLPDSFVWLGRGTLLGFPVSVLLMFGLYGLAYLLMHHTVRGREIYAVGGNPEAARFSGVPVGRVLLFVYAVSGLLAGVGGVVLASQLKSGSPTYGQMYELFVVAAAVVGGASLAGGEGKVLGTLIGAFTIAVIQNGMNLTGVESYTQKVVLGAVILGAVLVDRLKRLGWRRWWQRRPPAPDSPVISS